MTGSDILRAALVDGSPPPTVASFVRPDNVEQKETLPFIVYRLAGTYRDFGLDNTLLCTKETFHIECWGETRDQCEQLKGEVVNALIAAGLPPSEDEADGIAPDVREKASIVVVDIWIDNPNAFD